MHLMRSDLARIPGLVRGVGLSLMALLAISCGGSDGAGGTGGSGGAGPYEGVPRDLPPLVVPTDTWTWIDVPESQCDDGTPTGFAVNRHDPGAAGDDLFIFFQGGGACWDYTTCFALNTSTHGPIGRAQWDALEPTLPAPFDRTRASNPFRDATMVFIPYCTGDLHVGDNVVTYPQGFTTYHKGRPNTIAYLSRIASTWTNPTRVIYSGSSAGGYGATLSYDLARRTFPAARMYLIDDAGPLLEGDAVPAAEKTAWIAAWNIGALADGLCDACRTDLSGTYPALVKRFPHDRMALLSSLQDQTIRTYFMLMPAVFQTDILQLVAHRLDPTTTFRSFLIDGAQHTLLGSMTTSTTAGVVLEPWLDQMVNDRDGWTSVKP